MDLELLRSFVSVVDAGGFTRAGEQVNRTQSTVSQQIRRLEDSVGRPLLLRHGRRVAPTEAGDRLLLYARRLLALADEARDAVVRPGEARAVRLGVPEEFAAYRLARLLAQFTQSRPGVLIDVRCDLSSRLRRDLVRGAFDVVLVSRDPGDDGGYNAVAVWPERLRWVTSARFAVDCGRDPVPLVLFEEGCLYRRRAVHLIEAAGRAWRIACTSSHLAGVQAAVSAGLGISVLQEAAVLGDHRVLGAGDGFAAPGDTELALLIRPDAGPAMRGLAALLAQFCRGDTRAAAGA